MISYTLHLTEHMPLDVYLAVSGSLLVEVFCSYAVKLHCSVCHWDDRMAVSIQAYHRESDAQHFANQEACAMLFISSGLRQMSN